MPGLKKNQCASVPLTKEYEKVHLIAIGPLTNLAVAFTQDSSFPSRLESLTIMGGNMYG